MFQYEMRPLVLLVVWSIVWSSRELLKAADTTPHAAAVAFTVLGWRWWQWWLTGKS